MLPVVTNATADAGKAMVKTLGKIGMEKLSSEQMKTYMDITDAVLSTCSKHWFWAGCNCKFYKSITVFLNKDFPIFNEVVTLKLIRDLRLPQTSYFQCYL